VHHQLRSAVEQVEQADCTVRPFERVRPVDADHRQPAPVGVHSVARPGQFLLLGQQLLTGGQPLLPRHHLGQVLHRRHIRSPLGSGLDGQFVRASGLYLVEKLPALLAAADQPGLLEHDQVLEDRLAGTARGRPILRSLLLSTCNQR
jgi:hypothetical protein